jgi:transposase InsO family protein
MIRREEVDAWNRLTPDARTEAERRYRILARKIDATREDHDPHIRNKQLAQDANEAEANVCRWLKQWESGLDDRDGGQLAPPSCKAALAPLPPGPPKGRSLLSEERQEEIRQLAAKLVRRRGKPKPLPVTAVLKQLRAKEELVGDRAPSRAQIRSVLRRVPYQSLLAWAGGIEELKKSGGLPRLVVPPPEAPNIEWYGDQWVADTFVKYEDGSSGRPIVFSFVDRFGGGFVAGLAIHRRFTGYTVTEALEDAISREGRPKTIRIDLGHENRTKRLRSGCGALGIELRHTTPRDPAVKGLQEQTHGGYRQFCSTLPWYAPSDIKTKPLRDEPMLTFAEFCERFRTFVFGEYNLAPYTGLHGEAGKSRLDLRQAVGFTRIRVPEEELRILFAEAKLVTVWPQGIKLHGLVYSHPSLGARIGEKVWARQGRTNTEVIVHDEGMHLVCVARNALAEAAQLDDEGRRQFTADRRALAKARAMQADEQISRAKSRPDYLLLRAQKRMAEQEGHPPRPGIRQVTPATGQTPEVASAQGGGRLKRYRWQK